MTNEHSTQRWIQRFENLDKAYRVFSDAMEHDLNALSDLEEMGCVQAFEVVTELSWNVMKDYLKYQGVNIESPAPKAIVKDAFEFKLIDDGQAWIDILDDRNVLSHQYDHDKFMVILQRIQEQHFFKIEKLHSFFKSKIL